MESICPVCGKTFQRWRRRTDRPNRCCSRKCGVRLAIQEGRWHLPNPANSWGSMNTNWKGGIKYQDGYKLIIVPPGTPGRSKRGYMMEHRHIMQQQIGRPLEAWEKIHHRNGIKDDNRPENLEIVTLAAPAGIVTCPNCQHQFKVH